MHIQKSPHMNRNLNQIQIEKNKLNTSIAKAEWKAKTCVQQTLKNNENTETQTQHQEALNTHLKNNILSFTCNMPSASTHPIKQHGQFSQTWFQLQKLQEEKNEKATLNQKQ